MLVFPAPLGPSKPKISPSNTSKSNGQLLKRYHTAWLSLWLLLWYPFLCNHIPAFLKKGCLGLFCFPIFYLELAHFIIGIINLRSSTPSCVREYSTLGGISANASLFTKPSVSSSLSLSVNDLGLILYKDSITSLNRNFSWFPTSAMIWRAHFLLMTAIIPSRGQRQTSSPSAWHLLVSLFIVTLTFGSRFNNLNFLV